MERERRHGQRIQPIFRVRTEVLPEIGDIHMAVFADIQNISEAGMCLRSPLKLKTNDRILVFIPRLEEKTPLEIPGVVRWVKNVGPLMFEYGMEFSGIDKFREATIRTEIKTIMQSYFKQKSIQYRR